MNQEQRQQELLLMQTIHETCLSQYLTKEEAVSQLYQYKPEQVKLGENFLKSDNFLVWDKLEEQNPEYFRLYRLRLIVKNQMSFFNDVAYLMKEPGVKQFISTSSSKNSCSYYQESPSPSGFRVTN
jgi:uncharacterized protein (TIGR01589 family)